MNNLISQSEFARRVGVTRQTINNALKSGRIKKEKSGKINWDTQNKAWEANKAIEKDNNNRSKGAEGGSFRQKYNEILATKQYYEAKLKEIKLKDAEESAGEGGLNSLKAKKIEKQIINLEKKNRDLELAHEIRKQNLISSELIGIYLGFIASGISNNFLTIGNKIARGDTKLKDRIDKMISTAIKKTLSSAEKELRKESEQIIKYMEGEG